jgi:hypothetical protein
MAKLLCRLHWNGEKVVKTYKPLSTEQEDTVLFITHDSQPFIIKTDDPQLAKRLGLVKVENTDHSDLYRVATSPTQETAIPPNRPLPDWLKLKCGTLKGGKFIDWGGVGPDGYGGG